MLYLLIACVFIFSQTLLVKSQIPTNISSKKKLVKKDLLKKKISHPRIVRVLLDEFDLKKSTDLVFSSKNGFLLESPIDSKKMASLGKQKLELQIHKSNFYLKLPNETFRKIKNNELAISNPYHKRITLKDKSYEGTILIRIDEKNNTVLVINKVDLESYIYSVLRSESIPYWPLEMQKIQAVASRSYCMHLIKNRHTKNNFYDLKNSNFNQLYNGHHRFEHLRQAVEQTTGQIIVYNNGPALAMFDVACGGIIPSLMKHKDQSKPYLCRDYRCTLCKRNMSCYVWKEDIHENDFLSYLRAHTNFNKQLIKLGKLKNIRVLDKDKAGIVHKIELIGSRNNVTLPCKALRSSIRGRFTSMAIAIKKQHDRIVITGHGHGHHLGLCQCGARELVARGWDYKKVLDFYFPKTKLARLL